MDPEPIQVTLRPIETGDLPAFFVHQQDPEARHMAAFTSADPFDEDAFHAHWARLLREPTVLGRTVLADGEVAGYISSYEDPGGTEVTYWIARPLHARAAQDNTASLRVLQRCGFTITGRSRGHANARAREIAEYLLTLPA